MLKVEDFYRDSHQIIYRAIRDLYDLGKAIDAITLDRGADQARASSRRSAATTRSARSSTAPPHAANAKYYAQIVRQKAISRELIEAANEILRDGYSNNFTADELLQSAERRIFAIAEEQASGETVELKDVIVDGDGPDHRPGRGPRTPSPGVGDRATSTSTRSPAASRGRSSSSSRPGRAWGRRRSP